MLAVVIAEVRSLAEDPLVERPVQIETRSQVGHWEGDTVIGANHQQAVVTLVERKSGDALIAKVLHKTAD